MQAAQEEHGLFVFEASQRITYNTKKAVPLKEVVLALQGLDGVLKALPGLLSGITGVEIEASEFLVQRIEAGSLVEDIVVRFFFRDRAHLDAFVGRMGQNKVVRYTVIAAGLAGLVGYGVATSISGRTPASVSINNSVIFANGAGAVNITPEAFEAAVVAAASGDKRGVAESALKFLGPARADLGSSVVFAEGLPEQQIEINAAAIAEAPAKIELAPNERHEEFKRVPLAIRATNLDSKKQGWAGKLAHREERLPIELDPSVAESEMFGRTEVMVDAALVFREKGRGRELKPARIYVRKVYP